MSAWQIIYHLHGVFQNVTLLQGKTSRSVLLLSDSSTVWKLLPLWHQQPQIILMIYGVYLKSEQLFLRQNKKKIPPELTLNHVFYRTGFLFQEWIWCVFREHPNSQGNFDFFQQEKEINDKTVLNYVQKLWGCTNKEDVKWLRWTKSGLKHLQLTILVFGQINVQLESWENAENTSKSCWAQ